MGFASIFDVRKGRSKCILLIALAVSVESLLTPRDSFAANDNSAAVKTAKDLYQRKQFQSAIDILNGALRSAPNDPEAQQILALSYYSIGKLDSAVPLLEHLQGLPGPAGFDTSYLVGMCYLKLSQRENARAAFARMYAVDPQSAAAHLFFARILVREHREDEAETELHTAISLGPSLGMAHFLLGEIYLHKGTVQSAIAEFRREVDISPAIWLVYWRLADALLRINAYDDAERAAKQGIWLNESFSGCYVTLGEIALKKDELELAQGLLERSVRMEPGNQSAHYALARTYQRLGKTREAAREFELSRSLLQERNPSAASAAQAP